MNKLATAEQHLDFGIENQEFLQDTIEGLSQSQKTLPCKYFYDEQGSSLFEQICLLDEYYVTRTEKALMQSISQDISQLIASQVTVIEPGSGAGEKIHWLLEALNKPAGYIAMDISPEILLRSKRQIKEAFPQIEVASCVADFNDFDKLANLLHKLHPQNPMLFFPGSTIGNLTPDAATAFLQHYGQALGPEGSLLIGVDLIKPKDILEAAYNDAQGVTAAFNLNLLTRINRELNADFEPQNFTHHALFNPELSRIEMHLISKEKQSVHLDGHRFEFEAGESIHTENSYKYHESDFCDLLNKAGFEPSQVWLDEKRWFAIVHAQVAKS